MANKQLHPGLLEPLSMLSGGTVTVSVSGYPVVSIRADDKELDLEVSGVKEAGMSLSDFVSLQESGKKKKTNVLRASESAAKELSEMGWKLTLYDSGTKLLTMGHGVSRLTGHITLNPLRAKKLIDALR